MLMEDASIHLLSLGVIYYDVTDSVLVSTILRSKERWDTKWICCDTPPESPPDFLVGILCIFLMVPIWEVFTDLYKSFLRYFAQFSILDAARRVLLFNLPEDWEITILFRSVYLCMLVYLFVLFLFFKFL